MGSSALMSIGTRAMAASFAALQTTGHNIANASVDGYSRQGTELSTSKGQFTGAGFFGKGVDVTTITRSHDAFLTREAATAAALASMDRARADQQGQLEKVFPTGERGIGHAAGQLFNALVDMANQPQDTSTREVVLARADEVAARFDLAGDQLDALQTGVTADLTTAVESINGLTQRIAQVNQQVALARGLGHTPNDLLDQREALIHELSTFMQLTTLEADDGTTGVFIAGGQRLVLSNQAVALTMLPDTMDSSRSTVGIVETNGARELPIGMLGGGSVTGLLRFQNEDLAHARNLVGQMARSLADRVNDQQALGVDLRTPAQRGTDLFLAGAPRVQAALTNSGVPPAAVGLAVSDASLLQAAEYELAYDGSTWSLTKRGDDNFGPLQYTPGELDAGVQVEGFTIGPVTGTPTVGDRFLLQPVSYAAEGMTLQFDDARGLAAASPLAGTAASGNTGTATLGTLRVVSQAADTSLDAEISFVDNAGVREFNWVLRDHTTQAVVSSSAASQPWVAGAPIEINGFELTLNGVPAAGDSFTVGPTAFPAANNGNALALAALRDEAFVGRRLAADGTPMLGESITSAYASAMASVGVRVQTARAASEISSSVAVNAEQQRASKSGVNLDEEAAKLIQFQQSYQAAAKVLQVAQQVFDTLLNTVGQ